MCDRQTSGAVKRSGPQLDSSPQLRYPEDRHESAVSFDGKPLFVPERYQGVRKPYAPFGIVSLNQPIQCCAKVVLLGPDDPETGIKAGDTVAW